MGPRDAEIGQVMEQGGFDSGAAGAGGAQGAAILAEITADLAAGSDLRSLLQRFLEPITQLAGAQAGAVRVLSEAPERLQLVGDFGRPEPVRCTAPSVDRHCGVCGLAVSEDRIAWTSDLGGCVRQTQEAGFGGSCTRVLAVPMANRGRVLGVCTLFFDDRRAPDPAIAAVLKSVGELLGLALDNARLERESLRATLTQERQQMAAEVHDSIAQTLAFVRMRLPLLEESVLGHDDAMALKYLEDVRQAIGEAHGGLREIIDAFRAPIDPQGLVHALKTCADSFGRRYGIELEFVNSVPRLALSAAQESQAIQIVREALANVAKHASARRVRLALSQEHGEVAIAVEDDGNGLASGPGAGDGAAFSHHGLEIMRERARRIGGVLEVSPRTGGGTIVRLQFPVRPATAATP